MTAADQTLLDNAAKAISSLENAIQDRKDRMNLINSSFASGNFQPFGAYTVAQENIIKPQLTAELDNIKIDITKMEADLAAKKTAFANLKQSLVTEVDKLDAQKNLAIESAKAAAANAPIEIAKNEAQYHSKSVMYIVIAIGVVAVVTVVLYFKFRKKGAAA